MIVMFTLVNLTTGEIVMTNCKEECLIWIEAIRQTGSVDPFLITPVGVRV